MNQSTERADRAKCLLIFNKILPLVNFKYMYMYLNKNRLNKKMIRKPF